MKILSTTSEDSTSPRTCSGVQELMASRFGLSIHDGAGQSLFFQSSGSRHKAGKEHIACYYASSIRSINDLFHL